MRLTLIDVLVLLGLLLGGAMVGEVCLRGMGQSGLRLTGMGVGFGAGVVLASYVYRRLRWRPLLMPRCPHCQRRPELYGIAGGGWPSEVVVCGSCHGACRLWYVRGGPPHDVSDEPRSPSLSLRWPYFIGLWREDSE